MCLSGNYHSFHPYRGIFFYLIMQKCLYELHDSNFIDYLGLFECFGGQSLEICSKLYFIFHKWCIQFSGADSARLCSVNKANSQHHCHACNKYSNQVFFFRFLLAWCVHASR